MRWPLQRIAALFYILDSNSVESATASRLQVAARNYYHWVVEALSRLMIAKELLDADPSITVLVRFTRASSYALRHSLCTGGFYTKKKCKSNKKQDQHASPFRNAVSASQVVCTGIHAG